MIVDLGASRTALGRFSLNQGRLRLEQLAVEALPGHPGGGAGWLEQTRTALSVLRTRAGTRDPVVLVLPPHLTLTKLIKTPRVEPARRAKVLRFEAEQGIPFALADVVWDTVAAAEHESELELLLAAARREALEELCTAVRTAGFEPRLVLPSALATLAAFRLVQGAPTEPVLVLNLGARSTTLLQVTGQRFTARSLALGTGNIRCDQAEPPDRAALEALATRLAQEITRSVLHFRRQGSSESPARVCLTGGGARLGGLGEVLAARLKLPVDRLDLSGVIEPGRGVAPGDTAGDTLTLADLAGAAATQLRPGHPVLNLLPPSLRRNARRRRRLWLAAATLVAAAVSWPLIRHLPPAAQPGSLAAVSPPEAKPRPDAVPAAPSAVSQSGEAESFDLELLDVKAAPFPLQVAGYFGKPGDYLVAFISTDRPETLLVRRGHRFERHGFTLRNFEVRKIAVDHGDAWPVYEAAGFAVLHDEKNGGEVVLDSRRKPHDTLRAVLQGAADNQPGTWQEGELIAGRGATYRIQRIQADPPEVVLVRHGEESDRVETRVLQPARPETGPVPENR